MNRQPTFEEVFTYAHLFQCGKKVCKGVRWKCSTQQFEMNMPRWIANISADLYKGKYKSKGFTEFDIVERGKHRHITAVHISERCVQKCLCEYFLKPLLQPKLIYDNSANIKGKGTDFAIKRLKKQLAHHYKKYGRTGGVLVMDYHNYFGSIDHNTLLKMLREDIEDDRLYDLTKMFIDCFDGDVGLGLGSEVSQILAVYYRNKIDHYAKEKLHLKGYGAYMDDSIAVHHDLEYLKRCEKLIREMGESELGIRLNSKTRVISFNNGFPYLKKRFLMTDTGKIVVRLSRTNIRRRRQLLKKQVRLGVDADVSMTCWRGYAMHYNSYYTVMKMNDLFSELVHGKDGYVRQRR